MQELFIEHKPLISEECRDNWLDQTSSFFFIQMHIQYIPIELAGANSPAPLIMALLEVKDELFLMEDPEADPPDPGAKLKLVLDMDCGDDEGVIISLYSNL